MQRTYNKITFLSMLIALLLVMLFVEALATPETISNGVEINAEVMAKPEKTEYKLKEVSMSLVDSADETVQAAQTITNAVNVFNAEQLQERENIVDTKVNSFTTVKTLKEQDIVAIEPIYDANNKQVIERRSESMCLDIRNRSNWTYEDFDAILNNEMKDLIPVALRLEEEVGINAIYIIAVGANETGWGKHMAGNYNYFNWTNDGENHFGFDSIEEFADFSINTYRDNYVYESFYEKKLGFMTEHITLEVVNVKYALYADGTTNWQWSNVVAEIMSNLSDRRLNNV